MYVHKTIKCNVKNYKKRKNYLGNRICRLTALHPQVWDWILQQVKDPHLAPHFHWDAQHLSKFDGATWVRFFDEPWTADKFYDVQVSHSLC